MTGAQAAAGGGRVLPLGRRTIDALIPDVASGTVTESPTQIAVRRLRDNRIAQVAAVVFIAIVIACMSASWVEQHWAGRTMQQQNLSGKTDINGKKIEVVDLRGNPVVGPGVRTEYTLGADKLGRDVFVRVLHGGRISLRIAFGAALVTILIALALGVPAGYFKGRTDSVISRLFDVLLAFPSLLFAISLSTALAASGGFWFIERGSVTLQTLIIGGISGPYFGRIVRGQVLSLAERDFVEAAKALGATHRRIMVHDLLPHLTTTIITYLGILISANLLTEAALSFLGVGVLPPTPSWGNIINDGKTLYATAWWIAFFPGLLIMLSVLSLNLIGEAMEEAFDPKAIGGK